LTRNQIAVSKEITLNVDQDAYYAFRYFTDFDTDMVNEMKSFIKNTKDKKCFLDIGSHYGIFSLVFSSNSDTIAFAIEPSASAYKILDNHCHLNSQCRIKAFQLAFGDSEGKLQMQGDVSDHLVVKKSNSSVIEKNEKTIDVDVTTIDSFISKQNIVPDVIKIDTEGFELNILKGAVNFLNNYNPMIFLEVHPAFLCELGYSVEELIEFLGTYKYKIYDLNFKLIPNPLSYLSQDIHRIICYKSSE
jgi:FkbM family methyltransferase